MDTTTVSDIEWANTHTFHKHTHISQTHTHFTKTHTQADTPPPPFTALICEIKMAGRGSSEPLLHGDREPSPYTGSDRAIAGRDRKAHWWSASYLGALAVWA